MTETLNFRIHPSIGIARVGNSAEYYLAPETAAGDLPADGVADATTGGLPIKPGTESDTITSDDIRDNNGAFKRQAARFKIYQYALAGAETYPLGPSACLGEIRIGSVINGKAVVDIIWTVHLANKKAGGYTADDPGGIEGYMNGQFPPLRNANWPEAGVLPNDPRRLQALVIDPGPRTVSGNSAAPVSFDTPTTASYFDGNEVVQLDYPKSFPSYFPQYFPNLGEPQGPIDTLGEIQTDVNGRLIVSGGYGRSTNWDNPDLSKAVDNDGWFDDASDGPVSAVLVWDDGTKLPVQGSAWVCVTDPSYAPQIKNVVSLWEDMYDAWIRNLRLAPNLFDGTSFNNNYKPGFYNQLSGIFKAAAQQQWIANLPARAKAQHDNAGAFTPASAPDPLFFNIQRNPSEDQFNTYLSPLGFPYMPLALGDINNAFLGLTITQYFFLQQWSNNTFNPFIPALGPGELLDQNVLLNCLGGRFSPGIDLTFIIRDPGLYIQGWENSGTGPFRINAKPLDYTKIIPGTAFLTEGYIPLHSSGTEPGDVLKLMALPWHTDFNSCANHPTDPELSGPSANYTFWSWPAQRPVAVFPSKIPAATEQWFILRGEGTETTTPANVCRYQTVKDILTHWQETGVVMQATAIVGVDPSFAGNYLETGSQFPDGTAVPAWPNFLPAQETLKDSTGN